MTGRARHALAVAGPALLACLLAGCGGGDDGPGTGGVSVEEAEALDQAAEMLDSQRLPPEALDEAVDAPGTDLAPGATADSEGR